jgi:RNA polymerase sigma-70 factor (ECF subfamily)
MGCQRPASLRQRGLNSLSVELDRDQSLLQALSRGEPEAAAALFRQHGAKMVAFARRYVGDPAAAEDVVTGLIGRWLERPPHTGSVEHVSAFLATSVYHAAIDWIRRERAEQGMRPRGVPLASQRGTAPLVDASSPSSVEAMRKRLSSAMERLNEDERLLLESHYGRALTVDECMAQLGITRAAFHQRVHRARARLARLLEAES